MSLLVSPRFNNQKSTLFYPEIKRKVNHYFESNNLSIHANREMVMKILVIVTGFVTSYVLLYNKTIPGWGILLLAATNGFFAALVNLNIGHDAIHGTISKHPWINKSLAILFNLTGGNDYIWKVKHNIVHHTFTNIYDHDDDLNQPPILRNDPYQPLWKIHKFQHLYLLFLYPTSSILWAFVGDYKRFFKTQIGSYIMKHPKKEIYRLFFFKAVYYFFYLVLPFLLMDWAWYQILGGFFVLHIVQGLTMAVIFQVSHLVEGIYFPEPDSKGKMQLGWAEHQMYTTANFSRKSRIVQLMFGGLNYQIEHHLFPKICHTHYKNITDMVKETALKYDLPYIEKPSVLEALRSHLRLMKQFGRETVLDENGAVINKAAS